MDRRVLWAIAEMDAHIERATTATLAAGTNLSPSRFAHLFSRELGVSPARYLHKLRMERSRILLERTFLSVKEVMAQVGIADPSHFSRDFRRYHGVSPSQARQAARLNASGFFSAHLGLLQLAGMRVPLPANSANKQ